MSIEHSIEIARSANHIFTIYKDVESWATWDPDIEAVGLDGEFSPGTSGWLKPIGAPRTVTRLVEVDDPSSFVVEARLPLCVMRFEHELEPLTDKTRVTHRVRFTGALAPVLSYFIGRKIRKGIEGTMRGLRNYAESLPEVGPATQQRSAK